jgi:2-polyprenyl-3-methyl-5-hydroxy-6-metoxy-1,4-benzoquinol methylase
MYLIKRLFFHIKNGSFFSAFKNLFNKLSKSIRGIPIGNSYTGQKALIYDDHRKNDPYWIAEDNCINEYISIISDEIDSVIDAPYGTGRFAPIYDKHNLNVVAIDLSSEMLEIAKVKHKKHLKRTSFLTQDMAKIPFDDSSFDLVVCFRFIPWIISFKNAKIALAELSRTCRKYAVIELCVGKHKALNNNINEDNTLWDNYNKEELTAWLKDYNFEVIDVKFLYDDKEHPGLSAFFCKKIN